MQTNQQHSKLKVSPHNYKYQREVKKIRVRVSRQYAQFPGEFGP
jgi:hypothetical protein